MVRLYFAGSGGESLDRYIHARVPHRLLSFLELKKDFWLPKTFSIGCHCDFVLDSGAFTFRSKTQPLDNLDKFMDSYIGFLRKHRHFFGWYAEMDILNLGSVSAYEHGLKRFAEANLRPLIIYHPFENYYNFETLCQSHDYIGIANKDMKSAADLESHVLVAERYGCKLHLFGLTDPELVRPIMHFQSAYSCDSTTYLAGNKFGRVHLFKEGSFSVARIGDTKDHHWFELFKQNLSAWLEYAAWLEDYSNRSNITQLTLNTEDLDVAHLTKHKNKKTTSSQLGLTSDEVISLPSEPSLEAPISPRRLRKSF